MLIAAVTTFFRDMSLAECLDLFADARIEGVEISAGGFQGTPHIDTERLIESEAARSDFLGEFSGRGIKLVALACHGNPLHPDENIRNEHRRDFNRTVELAAQLGVGTVVCLSGCPGTDARAAHPAWVSSAWPEEARQILKWQWEAVVLPYWSDAAQHAAKHDVRVAIEMHPSNVAYNPATIIKLRDCAGSSVGANIDPSHLFWQGIDPAAAVGELGDAVFHVHAKDTAIDEKAMATFGCLDGATALEGVPRAWRFAVPGEGHGEDVWLRFLKALNDAGYSGPLSIEHEARAVEPADGIRRAAKFLHRIIRQI